MKRDRVKIGLTFLLIIFVFSVLTLLFWDFVRDTIVVPVYYVMWLGGLVLNSIPQGLYLAIFLLICLYLGLNTVERIRAKPVVENVPQTKGQGETRYHRWRSICSSLSASGFYRNSFAWEARKLVLSMLAYDRGIDVTEAESLVKEGKLDVPETIRELIENREFRPYQPPVNRLRMLLKRLRLLRTDEPTDPYLERLVVEVITYLESYVETTYDGNRPPT